MTGFDTGGREFVPAVWLKEFPIGSLPPGENAGGMKRLPGFPSSLAPVRMLTHRGSEEIAPCGRGSVNIVHRNYSTLEFI
jgi:hypothetical protein